MNPTPTRRSFVRGLAGVAAATTVVGTAAAGSGGWTAVETATSRTLYDAVRTADGVYVVGAGGIVLRREAGGYETVLDDGPAGNGRDLYGAAVTDDGGTLWVVGASGAIGAYDVGDGVLTDHSAPGDVTNEFNDVSVAGRADDAAVHVAGDSGSIYSAVDGTRWTEATPGSGPAITALDFHAPRSGHAVDADGTVFATAGDGYGRLGIVDVALYGIDADGGDVTVSGGGGAVYEWNGAAWVRDGTGGADLRDVEACACGCTLAVGGSGAVFHERDGAWHREATPTGENLHAVRHCDGTAVAVGAAGTVIER